MRIGYAGIKLESGEQAFTSSGRVSSPFPCVDFPTSNRGSDSASRADRWLWENAVLEAFYRRDEQTHNKFLSDGPFKMSDETMSSMEEYLFNREIFHSSHCVSDFVFSGIKVGSLNMMMGSGEQVLTISGRATTPFPKVDLSTKGKSAVSSIRAERWLWENAVLEAFYRNDKMNHRIFLADGPRKMPNATKDAMEHYLFYSYE